MTNPIIKVKRVQNFETENHYVGVALYAGEFLFDYNRKTLRVGLGDGLGGPYTASNCPVYFPGISFNYADAGSATLEDTLPANSTATNSSKSFTADETAWYYFTSAATTPNTAISHLTIYVSIGNNEEVAWTCSGVVKENTSQGLRVLIPLVENTQVTVTTRAATAVNVFKIPILSEQVQTTWAEGE